MTERWRIDEPLLADPGHLTLALVRHGRTSWNAAGIIQGHRGPGLDECGHRQAEALAARLARDLPAPAAVLSSDLAMTRETAGYYAQLVGAPVQDEPRLREIDNGSWSGRAIPEVIVEHSAVLTRIRGGEDLPRGGGETVGQLRARARAVLESTARRHSVGTEPEQAPAAVLFTHGGMVRALVAEALGLQPGVLSIASPANCSVTVLHVRTDGGEIAAATLRSFNSIDHLTTAGAVDGIAPAEATRASFAMSTD